MERIPLVPDPPLSHSQLAFLRLHSAHVVISWQWVMLESMLRARSDRHGATIWRDELDDLVQRGLMILKGNGTYCDVTDTGRVWMLLKQQKERA